MTDLFICCDWGSSNFRLYLMDTVQKQMIGKLEDKQGIQSLFYKWKEKQREDQTLFFRVYLDKKIQELGRKLKLELSHIPVTLSGMASSSMGLLEVPYQELPVDICSANLKSIRLPPIAKFTNELIIFGGISKMDEVMRGEEVQIIGLESLITRQDSICILPGTHTKHVQIKKGKIVDFKTYMTGELFQLLKESSTLSEAFKKGNIFDFKKDYFSDGIRKSQNDNLLNSIFKVRTNHLLRKLTSDKNAAFLSGLLIGTELKSLKGYTGHKILTGNPTLLNYYKFAIELLHLDESLIIIPSNELELAIPRAHLSLLKVK